MNSAEKSIYAYIGTYTQNGGKGIYIYRQNPVNGSLEPAGTSSELKNPSYIAISSDNRYLYAVSETESTDGVKGGTAAAYMIERHTGRLMFLNSVTTKGSMPCHICTDKANTCLFAANYGEGSLIAYRLNPDGSIGPEASYIRHHGHGKDPERQEKPHVHFTTLTPDERFLCAVDLGIDKVIVYGINEDSSLKMQPEELSAQVKPGSGPRHMAFSRDGRFAWVINELTSDIVTFAFNTDNASFTELQSISALPEGYTETSYCSAIKVSPDGKCLYASNRGHDSIAVFKINTADGRLGNPCFFPSLGNWPRDFSFDPSGRFLYTANQHSSTIKAFAVKPESGGLDPIDLEIEIPEPVCIKFAEL